MRNMTLAPTASHCSLTLEQTNHKLTQGPYSMQRSLLNTDRERWYADIQTEEEDEQLTWTRLLSWPNLRCL